MLEEWVRQRVRGQLSPHLPPHCPRPPPLSPVVCWEVCKAGCRHFCLLSHCGVLALRMRTAASSLTWPLGICTRTLPLHHTCSQPTEPSSQTTEIRNCWYRLNGQAKTTERMRVQFGITQQLQVYTSLHAQSGDISWLLPVPGLLPMISGKMRELAIKGGRENLHL